MRGQEFHNGFHNTGEKNLPCGASLYLKGLIMESLILFITPYCLYQEVQKKE